MGWIYTRNIDKRVPHFYSPALNNQGPIVKRHKWGRSYPGMDIACGWRSWHKWITTLIGSRPTYKCWPMNLQNFSGLPRKPRGTKIVCWIPEHQTGWEVKPDPAENLAYIHLVKYFNFHGSPHLERSSTKGYKISLLFKTRFTVTVSVGGKIGFRFWPFQHDFGAPILDYFLVKKNNQKKFLKNIANSNKKGNSFGDDCWSCEIWWHGDRLISQASRVKSR